MPNTYTKQFADKKKYLYKTMYVYMEIEMKLEGGEGGILLACQHTS